MKIAAIASVLVGLMVGTGAAFLSYSNPGPDLARMMREQPSSFDYTTGAPGKRPQDIVEVVGGDEFDFGVMDRGQTRSHTFVVRNNSDRPLKLEVTGTTCKCAVGQLENDVVPPDGAGEVTLEWVAKSLDVEFRQSATISTDSPQRPSIILSVYGRVLQIVQAIPPDVAFSDVPIRDAREAEFTLYGFKDESLSIIEHRWTDQETAAYFEFDWKPAGAEIVSQQPDAQAAALCTVRMKSGLPLGPVRQVLELVTNVSTGVIDVPIQARIVGDVSISGAGFQDRTNTLRIGPVAREAGVTRKLFMTVKGPYLEGFQITGWETDPADVLQVQVGEEKLLRAGKVMMIPLEFSIPAGARPVNYSGGDEHPVATTKITTTHPEVGEITIRVTFAITE